MLKKLAVLLGAFAMVFATFFGPAAHAKPSYWFTEDGKYDGRVKPTKSEPHVSVTIWEVYYVNHKTKKTTPTTNYSKLSVRLCNASTGKCTSFKKFKKLGDVGYVDFYSMKPGTYNVDIVDSSKDHYYHGQIDIVTFSDGALPRS